MNIFLIIFFLIIFWICYYYFRRITSPIPGPLGIPILGYLPFLNPKTPYKTLHELSQKYGPIYGTFLGSVYTVVLSDPGLIREAFKKDEFSGRAPLYLTHGIMGGHGIICAEGPLWKDQRRQLIDWLKKLGMTKFGSSRAILEKIINSRVEEFINTIRTFSDGYGSFEMDPIHILHHSMGNILNKLVFGVTYDRDDVTWKYLQKLQEEGVKLIGVSGVVNFLPLLRLLPSNKKTIKFLLDGKKRTHKIYDEIIEKWSKILENKDKDNTNQNEINNDGNDNFDDNDEEVQCILECFLKEHRKRIKNNDPSILFYSQEQLRHLLADTFGAGLDTSFTTLRWFLLYMAKYSEIQSELRLTLYANDNGDLPLSDLEENNFLKACISETQRIRSVVPLGIPHGASQVGKIGQFVIPKNSMIVPLLWAVHMNQDIWPNPEEFKPSRFLTLDGKYNAPQHFIPFQTGKRMCLGDELARMMLYKFCAKIIYKYELSLSPLDKNINMEGECGITLTPLKYILKFKEVSQQETRF